MIQELREFVVGTEKQLTEAIMYNVLGNTFFNMANFRMSISCGFQSIYLLNQLNRSPQVNAAKVAALYNLQSVYISRGEQLFQHAGKWVEMALQLHNNADSEMGIRLRIRAAEVHIIQLEYTRALQELKLCLEVCKQKGYREMCAKARVKMGWALRELGNNEASLSFSKEAMSEFEEMGNVEGTILALINIGFAQLEFKQFDEALGSSELALNLNLHPTLECDIKNFIGYVYLVMAYSNDCNNFGTDALLQKCKKYSIEAKNHAIKINSEWHVIKADINLAQTYAFLDKSKNQDHAQFFENLLDRGEKSKFPDLSNIYFSYTHYLFYQGEFEKAIEYGLKTENVVAKVIQNLKHEEAILTRKNREDDKICSKILQICYIFNNSPGDALLVCERSKTRSSNILISASNTSNMQITIENIKNIALQINSPIVVLSEAGPNLFRWLILPNKILPIKFFAFVIRTNLLNNVESFVELQISSIEQMRSSETFKCSRKFPLSNPDAVFKSKKDSKMFDIVLQNIEGDLCSEKFNSMVIVPDGSQYNARFSCAKSINNSSTPLCLKCAVSICPSLSMIMDMNSNTIESNNQIKSLLIIGDPQSNLPFAIKEYELLKDLYKKSDWNVDALIGSNATKQRVVDGLVNCKIIHIAAHANLKTDTLQVLRGSILLAACDSGLFYSKFILSI